MMGLTQGSYEAYCLDQAVWYFGSKVQEKLNKVGVKPPKDEAKHDRERLKILGEFLGSEAVPEQKFADPAVLFGLT